METVPPLDKRHEQAEITPPPQTAKVDTDGTPPGAPLAAPAALSADRYEILGELGRGGMGVVYRARDSRTGRIVALKTMQRRDGTSLEFFKREFRHLQGVSHPNLVQLYELESDGNDWLLTMELVEGVNFLAYVRPGASSPHTEPSLATAPEAEGIAVLVSPSPLHLERLREALGQLAEGIAALHGQRRVHRDLKPGNVRVTPEGRVVVLDFGLTTDVGPTGEHQHTGQMMLGTFAYMAPEQGQSPPVSSPASDWYSVGVMLYQALTGRLPFTGGAHEVMRDKQSRDPKPPRHICPDVPNDLNDLCLALLRRKPQDRATGAEVLERLGRTTGTSSAPVAACEEAPLLGRERHLRFLEDAYAASRLRQAVLAAVRGPSGVGKSALVRHFLDGLRSRGAIVLAGRCYEHESVPYKALDPVVDELGRFLQTLPHHEVEGRLPRDVGPLMRVFPVLGTISALSEAAARSSLSPDPQEVRRRAFAGLRELLARVGDRQPLVLYIDDLQWGDIDSAYLIADLLQPPDSPPLLLVTSYRSEDADSPCLRALAQTLGRAEGIDRRELAVAPLTEAETRELVLKLLGPDAECHAASIFRESGGNPFFITEFVQAIQSGNERDMPRRGAISLEWLIRTRVERLPEGARRLLEAVAVSGRPVGEAEACRAARTGDDARTLVARLEAARFVRGTQVAEESRLETYHDRIRETVANGLSAEARRDYHGRLAQALEESGRGDPEEVAVHFEGAGEIQKAGAYYGQAADRAAESLAFDHAAALYQKSLNMRRLEVAEARDVRKKLGGALANAGRGAEAGPVYLAAAEGTEGREEFELRLRAADQLLSSGSTREGLEVLESLMRPVGLRLAGGKYRALFGMILERVRVRLRGLKFRERPAESIPAVELMRIDTCDLASHRLSMVNVAEFLLFQAKHIRLALQAGEPSRIVMAVSNVATLASFEGRAGLVRAERISLDAISMAERLGNPLILARANLWRGYVSWAGGKWKEGLSFFELAEEIAAKAHVTHAMGLIKAQHGKLDCLMMLGRWREMACCLPGWLNNARRRGDLFATSALLVHSYVPCLAADRPKEAEALIDQCWEAWPHAGNVMGTYWSLYGRAETALLRGEGNLAWNLVRRERASLNRSTLFEFMPVLKLFMTHLQARAALASAAVEPKGGWYFSSRARLLRSAAREARRTERRRMPWSNPLAKLIRAGIANQRGNRDGAVSLLAAAENECQAADQELYAAAARRQRGRLLGGEEGQALVASADAWMAGQDIRNPARIAAMLAPGFPD